MTFASGANRGLSYVEESSFGQTPASPTMKALLNTGANLNMSANSLEAYMRNGNRQLDYLRRGTFQTGGEIPFNLMYGAYDDFIEAVMCGTWTTDTLKVGDTFRSFTLEDRFLDIDQYRVFTGEVMDTFNLSVAPGDSGSYVTGSFGTIGKKMTVNQSQIASPQAAVDNPPLTTCDGVIKVDGNPVQVFNSFDVQFANNYSANYVIGDCSAASMTMGQVAVTGTLGAYLQDSAQVDRFINETNTALLLSLTGPEGHQLDFELPDVKFTSADVDTSEQAVNQNIEFTATYSATDDSTMIVTRTQ